MGLSAAEKNRRKRERKKKEKEERRKRELAEKEALEKESIQKEDENNGAEDRDEITIEYVSEDLSKILNATKANGNETTIKAAPTTTSRPDGLPPMTEPNEDDATSAKATATATASGDAGNSIEEVLRRFHERAAVVPSASDVDNEGGDDARTKKNDQSGVVSNDSDSDGYNDDNDDEYDDDDDDDKPTVSKRKLRELIRPTVAELKRRVARPDLVEAHDVTAADPDFLIALKAVPHTTPVPFHWGRKRKYLQGKRGMDKVPYELPEFILQTGITDVRNTAAEDEAAMSAKQKNRGRVNPRMGAMDVDYKVLYDAFFKFQTKPANLTSWGELYYEGKEMENSTDITPGGPYSRELRIALGMPLGDDAGGERDSGEPAPPPWLWNMQRFGPPPGHPFLKIPGLNAPLPNPSCKYGYHPGGWGKPPVDAYGRPLYGGNPLDPPGASSGNPGDDRSELVTSDGKTVGKAEWGGLPTGDDLGDGVGVGDDAERDSGSDMDDSSSSDDDEDEDGDNREEVSGSESGEDMEESDSEEAAAAVPSLRSPPSAIKDLRKESGGDETPAPRLYKVLQTGETTTASSETGGLFRSDLKYILPGASAAVPEGAESVLSKATGPPLSQQQDGRPRKKTKTAPDGEDDELEKNFKF